MTPERKVRLYGWLMTVDVIVGLGGFIVLVIGTYLRFNIFSSSAIFRSLLLWYMISWGVLFLAIMITQFMVDQSIDSGIRLKYGVGRYL